MNGATSLVKTLLAAGVDTCFANPGTSEMHFVAALDETPGMRCVLGLQENVVTGMADGYFRIARKSACTLLHCGPGLANGLGNLHNARRARSGIVNLVGDQASWHRQYDAPLTSDTDGLARSVSAWVRTSGSAQDVGKDGAAAVHAANAYPGTIATLILPSDTCWDDGGVVAQALPPLAPASTDPFAVENAARVLRTKKNVLILLAGNAVFAEGQALAWRVAQATGATLRADFITSHLRRGRGCLPLQRIPYSTDQAVAFLKDFDHIVLVGAIPPVAFFAYPGKPSRQTAPHTELHALCRPDQDATAALAALVAALDAPAAAMPDPGARPAPATGAITPEGLAQTLAALMPDEAIVSDESISYGRSFYQFTHSAPTHDWLHLAGGAIGDGLPVATGAAIAAGGQRRVISLQADGSAMYSLQSLWTQARENLPCTTILLNNRKYNILINEYKSVGASPGETAMRMLDLSTPDIDWVQIASGMGVEAARATSLEQLADLLKGSFARPDPFLVDLHI
ncbi:acetolactate synthase large subunit [Cupriavidus sp. AU9028]|uniref:acetolactate synthase large subunit n=1 Tax=Cupriavidus sp. AU9028 TaxID=2871157 RepID=UPI001C97D3FE|nr:acetolactate synthase large subunit [Cupriavidus sp. AU9028]MBY4897793.1 acetolactate synthase large subunit [Cupriavidus sp. AU9028]